MHGPFSKPHKSCVSKFVYARRLHLLMIETGLNIRGFSYLSYSIDCVVSWVSGLISSGFNKHLQGADFFPRSWLLPFLSARIAFSGHCKTAADNSSGFSSSISRGERCFQKLITLGQNSMTHCYRQG